MIKWIKGAKKGVVVAGGQGEGSSLKQLSYPLGLIVNKIGDIYVADCRNHRIMYWPIGSEQGYIIVGGNGKGKGLNQLHYPIDLSFDVDHN